MKKWILCLAAFIVLDLLDLWPFEPMGSRAQALIRRRQSSGWRTECRGNCSSGRPGA